MHIRKY